MPYKYPGMESPVWVDVYNRMYRERIMFLSQVVDDNFANTIIAVLLYLESENAADPCSMTERTRLALATKPRMISFICWYFGCEYSGFCEKSLASLTALSR